MTTVQFHLGRVDKLQSRLFDISMSVTFICRHSAAETAIPNR